MAKKKNPPPKDDGKVSKAGASGNKLPKPKGNKRRKKSVIPEVVSKVPWERLEGETDPAYEAFIAYRDMPGRSIAKVAKSLKKSKSMIHRWSSKYTWTVRIDHMNQHIDRQNLKQREDVISRMNREHLKDMEKFRRIIMAPIRSLIRRMEKSIDPETGEYNLEDFDNLKPFEMLERLEPFLKHLPQAIKLERLLHGLSTDNIDSKITKETHALVIQTEEVFDSLTDTEFVELINEARRADSNEH